MTTKPNNDNRALMAHIRKQVRRCDASCTDLPPLQRFASGYACALMAHSVATNQQGDRDAASFVKLAISLMESMRTRRTFIGCRSLRVTASVMGIKCTKTALADWINAADRFEAASSSFERAQDVLFAPKVR